MKNKKPIVALAIMCGASMLSPNTYATNPYGMEYSGGEPLDASNVQIDPQLIQNLTPLIEFSNDNVIQYHGTQWVSGYQMNGNDKSTCSKINYIPFHSSETFAEGNEPYLTIANQQYTAKLTIRNIVTEDIENSLEYGENTTLFYKPTNDHLDVGYVVYSDQTCENIVEGTRNINTQGESKVFVEAGISLFNNKTGTALISDQLYFGIIDIDLQQSFKILNQDSLLTPSNMYATSLDGLQPEEGDLKNVYVPSDNYIYSQLKIGTNDVTNIYAKISPTTQSEGLRVVFGFAKPAGSNITYYAKQFVVKYESDAFGKITGITDEEILSGLNPSGSTDEPSKDYELAYWIVDKDVTLVDGTVIRAGEPLSSDQVNQVVVLGELTFTAIHEMINVPAAPNTGIPTKNVNALATPFFVAGIMAAIPVIGLFSKIYRRNNRSNH